MKKQHIIIENQGVQIPAILWGEPSQRLLLAVHGMQSHKEDTVIALAAEVAGRKGFCTLSFDLPEHGERVAATDCLCNPWNGRSDFLAVYRYAQALTQDIRVFACSLGAYFTMLAYPDIVLKQLLFLSPVVNMAHIIENMMAAADVTLARLEKDKVIPQPYGPALDWAYYCYVKEHPIQDDRYCPMKIFYGGQDSLCARADVEQFAAWYGADLTVLQEGEHYFHTEAQLSALRKWLEDGICPVDSAGLLKELTAKDAVHACAAAKQMVQESRQSNGYYPFLDDFAALLEHKNSLVRNRALLLLAANAKWDTADKINGLLDRILAHITDEKPITARQCIKVLPELAAAKPMLAESIRAALLSADVSGYQDSMRPLIEKDIAEALLECYLP